MDPEQEKTPLNSSKWEVAKPCFSRDVGTQRCRLPVQLISALGAGVGAHLLVNFGSHQSVCTVYVWKGQSGNCCQFDDTVIVKCAKMCPTASILNLSSFVLLRTEMVKRIKVDLILESYCDIVDFGRERRCLAPLIKDVLSSYAIMSGGMINCLRSEPCRLLKLHFIIVRDCDLKPNSCGKLTSKTVVEIAELMSRARHDSLSEAENDLAITLGGLDKPKQLLRDLVTFSFDCSDVVNHLGISSPRGILLIGPPGTGKTSLVRAVARESGACLVYVAGPSVCRPQPGESEAALRDVFRKAEDLSREGACVLFIDEVDSFLMRKGEKTGSQNDRLLSQMLTLMDGLESRGKMVIVGATNRPDVLDPAIRRPGRFDQEVYIGVPTKTERVQILKSLTSKLPLHEVCLENVADWTPGYVGADLALLCQEIAISKIYSLKTQKSNLIITESDFRHAVMLMRPSTRRGEFTVNDCQPTSWDDIGGLESVKVQLKQSLEWPIKHGDAFQRLGISRPKGVLLYGPPGCCKTTLVRAAATVCNASFLSASAAQLYSPYVGDSEKAVAELFHRSRLAAPTILFLDEIDSIVGKRGTGSHRGIHEKVLSTLLNEMDGIGQKFDSRQGSDAGELLINKTEDCEKDEPVRYPRESGDVFVVAATNRPDLLDEALMRPGRFDRIIYVPPPDTNTRKQILEVITRKMPTSNLDIDELALKTPCFSGADLENLCKESALSAITNVGLKTTQVNQSHFLSILETMKPSLTAEQLNFFDKLQQKYRHPL